MKISFFFILSVIITAACGCSSSKAQQKPQESVKVTLNVNIEEAAPAPVVAEKKKAVTPKKKTAKTKNAAQPVKKTPQPTQNNRPGGIIDSELNSVERSYVQNVRNRNRKNAQQSADHVFGSFKPSNLIKGK